PCAGASSRSYFFYVIAWIIAHLWKFVKWQRQQHIETTGSGFAGETSAKSPYHAKEDDDKVCNSLRNLESLA
ncbi:hypothetical protein, partial [uncultured Tateyamaria sp.]|uniref:hypothetical protein n=1 Tax=uncultured Tateyamaria sp. TaxID=455651 RepID=UPI00261285C0